MVLPRSLKRYIAFIFDAIICALTVWLAFLLRIEQWGLLTGNQWLVLFGALGISLSLFIIFGLYKAIFRYIGSTELASIIKVFTLYFLLFSTIFTVIGINGVPRTIGIIQPILFFICYVISRSIIRLWFNKTNYLAKSTQLKSPKVLIYGAGSAGRQLAATLSFNNKIMVKGFIDDDKQLQGNTVNGIEVYANHNLSELTLELGVTYILLAIPSVNRVRRNEIIASLTNCGVKVRTLPSMFDFAFGRLRISDLHDLDMDDLLGRDVVPPDEKLLKKNIYKKNILVTGAGGSIGSELCRQIIKFSPKSLILIDNSEHALYLIHQELKTILTGGKDEDFMSDSENSFSKNLSMPNLVASIASVRDYHLLSQIFRRYQPQVVFHAAAYKHVPMVESNPVEGISNNVFGTLSCAQVSLESGVEHFILVSTDKAVRPTNIMGASKRIAEMILQAMSVSAVENRRAIKFSMVRFGNVLGSSGSVAPLFSAQISAGGPITLTHPEVTRYFMTIPEAAQLVIQASSMAKGGDVFVLDMGKPVRVYDLAVKMIHLSGHLLKDEENSGGDIEIKIIGMRPGEKLFEELLIGNNPLPTPHPKIMKAHEEFPAWEDLKRELDQLNFALKEHDNKLIIEILKKLVPGYINPSLG